MDQQETEKKPQLRGLYDRVHISIRALDITIIACVVVIVIAMIIGMNDRGYNVTFDSRGGTDVPFVKCNYGELITGVEEPTREGYTFGGWYTDPQCSQKWVLSADEVTGAMTLYACWIPAEE